MIVIGTAVALLAGAGWTATSLLASAATARHAPAGRFVEVPGGRLHYAESGIDVAGQPAVVLLHGASSTHSDLFATLGPRLGGAHVLAFDRPGHGWSDRLGGREMADPARQAAAIRAALERLGIRRAVVVAHSLAGALATRLALDAPDLVSGLVLLGAVTHPWPGGITWYYHPASTPVLGPLFARLVAAPVGHLVLEASIAGVFTPQMPPPGYADLAQTRLVLRPDSFVANAEDVAVMKAFVTEQAPRYGELAMPVVAIAGEADDVVWTKIHSVGITRQARDARLITLPGVGHMPHHVVPGLIADEILRLVGPRSGA
jgi:pimeloyl-ACP methyl ester carboxylesterase